MCEKPTLVSIKAFFCFQCTRKRNFSLLIEFEQLDSCCKHLIDDIKTPDTKKMVALKVGITELEKKTSYIEINTSNSSNN